jgi:hypothetical protein
VVKIRVHEVERLRSTEPKYFTTEDAEGRSEGKKLRRPEGKVFLS